MILLVPVGLAMTLEEAVSYAAEVHPYAVVEELEHRKVRLEAAEAWSLLTITPEATFERRWSSGSVVDEGALQVTTGLFDAAGWFGALEQSAQARAQRHVADATALDARYAAAVLYVEALAAEASRDAAAAFRDEAERTREETRSRVEAGFDSPLSLQVAEVQAIEAASALARAESGVRNARARLERAVGREVGGLVPTRLDPPPADPARSPWIAVWHEQRAAARMEHAESWAELLPTLELQAETPFVGEGWTVAAQASWTFDGAGPILRARAAAIAARQAEVLADGLQRDHDLGVATGREDASSLAEVVSAARRREALALESLTVGQSRLAVGLIDALDVIELQEDVVRARVDRIEAELEEAYAILEARRLAGVEPL